VSLRITLERLVTAINRLTHAVEALIRLELAAEYRRQQEEEG
jgi:hypothetical protein